MITVGPLAASDQADWERLFRAYIAFYEQDHPQSMYDRAWAEFQADTRMHAFGAWRDGSLAGIGSVYWQTRQDNATARLLYDRVATYHGFIVYTMELPA